MTDPGEMPGGPEPAVSQEELESWIEVTAEDEPEIEGHGWRVDLADEVGLLVHPDRDDVAAALESRPGVRSVVQLDREVLVLDAPSLSEDGVRAAVLLAIAAAHELVDAPPTARRRDPAPAPPVRSADDDSTPRLVTGAAKCDGRAVQVWVTLIGILVLPAGTFPHGPLDDSENPHFELGSFSAADAPRLAEQHAGRWLPYPGLDRLRVRRPGPLHRRWRATVSMAGGESVSWSWTGTRAHALLLVGYVIAKCGLESVDGRL